MKRKKTLLADLEKSKLVFTDGMVRINKIGNEYIFEVGKEVTTDLAEAVSIMMRICDNRNEIWNQELPTEKLEIDPEKTLFWLTGGSREWRTLDHYNKPWCDCYLDFQEEFGFLVVNSVKKSTTFGDIKKYFLKYLNLETLYDFALSKELVR